MNLVRAFEAIGQGLEQIETKKICTITSATAAIVAVGIVFGALLYHHMALFTIIGAVEALAFIGVAVIAKRFADTVDPEAKGLSGVETSERFGLLVDVADNIRNLFAPAVPEFRNNPRRA